MVEGEIPKSLTFEHLRAVFDALNCEPESGCFFWRGRHYTAPTFSQAVDLAARDDPILSVLMERWLERQEAELKRD